MITRRTFINGVAVSAAGAAVASTAKSYGQILGANERVQVDPRHVREAYLQDIHAFVDRYRKECSDRNIEYVLTSTDTPYDRMLLNYLFGPHHQDGQADPRRADWARLLRQDLVFECPQAYGHWQSRPRAGVAELGSVARASSTQRI